MNIIKRKKNNRLLGALTIQMKIVLLGGLCLVLVAVFLIAYSAITMHTNSLKAAEREAQSQANLIAIETNKALYTARTLAQSLSAMKTQDIALSREQVNAMLKQVRK